MNDRLIPILTKLLQQYGNGLCTDTRRLKALLSDLAIGCKRESNALIQAADCRISQELAQQANPKLDVFTYNNFVRRLIDETSVTSEAAEWAVRAWATALNKQLPPNAPHDPPSQLKMNTREEPPVIQRNIGAANSLVYRANERADLNDHDDAIQLFNIALTLDPLCAEALSGRGWSKYLKGDLTGARSDLDQSIKIDAYPLALYRREDVRKAQGDYKGALEDHMDAQFLIDEYEIRQADIAKDYEYDE